MRSALASLILLISVGSAVASPIGSGVPDAEIRGSATFRFLGFPLYNAWLYTPSGESLNWSEDFALELEYLRNVKGRDLVTGTIRELTRTGATVPSRDQLDACFVDVKKGDRYAAVSDGKDVLSFWHNDARKCTLRHPEIKSSFMAIFLGEDTRSRAFTRRLRGE